MKDSENEKTCTVYGRCRKKQMFDSLFYTNG